jgi:hypothetical protein
MTSKICSTCQTKFTIATEDKQLYSQLGVPSPSLCPDCRHQRRLTYRNDRVFYNRKCDKSGKSFISIYAPEKPYTVYHPDKWNSDHWDPMDYGRDIDFSRPFFEQFAELQQQVPRLGIDIVNCENSLYCNYCGDDKNCYLDIAGEANEDCYFNLFTKYSKDCCDTTFAYHSTLCYESIQVYNGYDLNYSMYCDDTAESSFAYDLKGSKNCLFSANLRQKEYYIFNKPHTKEEYEEKLKALDFGSYSKNQQALKQWTDFRRENAIYRDAYLLNCENSSGNNLKNCKNTHHSFNATNCEDSKYLYDVLDATNCQDMNYSLYKPEVTYETISTLAMKYSAFNMASHYNHNVFYCEMINGSSDLFGCIGLKHKKYSILNKQYSKEEYEILRTRLIEHMKTTGEWGEFFPSSLSPWDYNETVANEYFPLTQEEALNQGFTWYENPNEPKKILQTYKIPDHIQNVPDSITNEILTCKTCDKNFKIIKQELTYYKKKGLPIPHNCSDCRHKERIKLRPPRQLFDRTCTQCKTPTRSCFNEKRPEKVYCETCYLKTLY